MLAHEEEPALNGGLPAVLALFSLGLSNSGGAHALRLSMEGEGLAEVTWTGAPVAGVSWQVADGGMCLAPEGARYGPAGDRGTPGGENRPCVREPLGWVVWSVFALLGLGACGSESACGPGAGVVSRVVDGDTVVLQSGERVRYLLVDTPESTLGKHECFGSEASDYNRSLVEGRAVRLTYAEACTDRYGRLLAYVSVDGREVNTLLAQGGYACVLYVSPAGQSRRTEFEALESAARRARRGVWGQCSPVPCDR